MKNKALIILCSILLLFQYINVFGETLRPDASAFPNRTIIIGTYAIVIDHMTNSILEKAEQSAQSENQNNIYYKSDINAGTWYDITQSSDISEISKTVDNIVSYQEINSLTLTHYVDETGNLIDLTIGNTVSVSDIEDVAYIQNMPELEGIEKELQIQKAMKEQGNKEAKKCYDSLERILKDLYSDESEFVSTLQNMDEQLNNFEKYIADLKEQDTDIIKINEAYNQKKAVENRRKVLCYNKVLQRLENEMAILDYNTNEALISKYAEYSTNIQATLPSLEEVQTDESSSQLQKMLQQTEYAFQREAGGGIKQSADNALERILAIKSAMMGEQPKTEQQKQQQKAILQQAKQSAEQSIQELSKSNLKGQEYQKAAQYGENESVLKQIQTEELLKLNVALDDVDISLKQLSELLSDEEMIDLYEQSMQNIEQAIYSISEHTDTTEQAKKSLEQYKNDMQYQRDVLQLNAIPEYQLAKKQKQQSQQQAEQKQQQYLAAAEQGNTELLESTKKEMDNAIAAAEQAEQKMEEIEQNLHQNNISENNAQNQQNNAENINTENKKNELQKNIVVEREDNYTQQEKQDILSIIEELQKQEMFFPPWYIVFQDYDVKLLSPIWYTNQQIYIPGQELARQLGAKVYKSKVDSTYILKSNGVLIQYRLEEKTISVNGEEMNISPPPTVHNNRVYLPLSIFEKAYHMEHIEQENNIIVYKI